MESKALVPVLEVSGIEKRYGGVHALKNVAWQVQAGEVHGLVGENGAGKSTLIKQISGAEAPDEGVILIDGRPLPLGSTQAALNLGVSAVYQEPQLFGDLTVEENIFLGREKTVGGKVQWKEQRQQAAELLERLNLNPELLTKRVADLPVGEQQLVSIAKAFVCDVRLLILDEPSAILANDDIDRLFAIVRSLKEQGLGVIYISHRLDELGQITDRITVLRDGEVIGTYPTAEMTPAKIAQAMVGEKFQIADRSHRQQAQLGEQTLKVDSLAYGSRLRDVSFDVRAGEIVGIYGLIGSGTTELIRCLYGINPATNGQITVGGTPTVIKSPGAAMKVGITMLPGNRKTQGVFLSKSLAFNLSSSHLKFFSRFGWFNNRQEKKAMLEAMNTLRVKAPSPQTPIGALSGGNQQKVVMARQLVENPKILLAEEPTQGVDVGAKASIHQLILDHVAQGNSAVVVSTDLEEIRFLADRIVVVHQGKSIVTLPGDVSAAELLSAASGELQTTKTTMQAGE